MAFLTMIGASIFGAGTFLAAATTFVLKTIVGIGLSLLAQAIAGKPKAAPFSIEADLRSGGDVPRSFIMGRTATAGSLVYGWTWGNNGDTPNAYYVQVIALSDLPLRPDAIEKVWVDGEEVTLLTGSTHAEYGWPVSEYRKDGKDHMWIKFYDGTQVAADPYLVSRFATNADFPYEATRVGKGVAYAICTSLINDKIYHGLPEYRFVLKGIKLYDPSKDSTVGGSGTQRYNTPSTWGGDGDDFPAVHIYNLFRGIYYNGQWLYGIQNMSAARLPYDNWITAIQQCRAPINIPGSTTEAQFRSGGEVQVNREIASILEEYTSACAGRPAEVGGVYKLSVGGPGASVAVITADDILITEDQSLTPFLGLADTINGMVGKFPNPAEAWNIKPLPPIYRSDYELLDGGRRLLSDIQLTCVPYEYQAQRLLLGALEEARRARRKTFTLPAWAWVLEPNDVVTITDPYDGDSAKKYRVDGTIDQPNLTVTVDLTEVDPADYNPPAVGDYRTIVSGPVGRVLPPPQPIVDFAAFPYEVKNTVTGTVLPGILLVWDGAQLDVDRVVYEVRNFGETVPFHTGNVTPVSRGSVAISQALAPSTTYQVRAVYDSNSGREFTWSSWLTVTTPAMTLTGDDLGPHIVTIPKFATDAATLFDKQKQSVYGTVAEWLSREQSQRLLRAQAGRATASYNEKITVVANATTAASEKIETLTATVDDNMSTVSSQLAAITTDQQALADSLTALTASLNNTSADARFRMTAVAGPSGVAARIEAQVRVNVAGSWIPGGWAIDVLESPPGSGAFVSKFTIYANYVFVVRPGDGVNVLFFDSSTSSLTLFDGRIISGYIGDQNGRWRQDMANAVLKVYDEANTKRVQLGNLSV